MPYSASASNSRERQAPRNRELIFDALTALLSELPSDEITTWEIAKRAGVSQPTVYRHFPGRSALLEGLTARILAAMKPPAKTARSRQSTIWPR